MRRPVSKGQPHREQRRLGLHPAQHHPQIVEIHLSFGRRRIGLRHAAALQRLARLGEDLRTTLSDVVAHRRIRDRRDSVLVHQPSKDAPRGMPLLARLIQTAAEHASINGFTGSNTGAANDRGLRGGGTALANA